MRKMFSFGPILLVVCALGCGGFSERQAMILGKWDVKQRFGNREIAATVEFKKDGSMTTEAMGMKIESSFRYLDDNHIEVEMSFGGRTITEKNKIERLNKKQMILVDPHGSKAYFTRGR